MFQTVGHHVIELYAEAIGLPLYRRAIEGGSVEQGKDYKPTEGDEVEDLYQLLLTVKVSCMQQPSTCPLQFLEWASRLLIHPVPSNWLCRSQVVQCYSATASLEYL